MRPFFYYSKTPSTSDKNAIRRDYGGYASNKISGSKRKDGYVLPNCVGFVHAQWLKMLEPVYGTKVAKEMEAKLSIGNAETYYTKKDGFIRGYEPKVGAIMCYEGKGSAAGHVEIVKEIKSNKDVICLSSAWGGDAFHERHRYRSSGYSFGNNKYQGCIYFPVEVGVIARNPNVDQIRVFGDVNIRADHSTSSEAYGGLAPRGYYDVMSVYHGKDYDWYQVEKYGWIAKTSRVEVLLAKKKTFDVTAYDVPEKDIEAVETFLDNLGLKFKSEEN